MIPFRPVHAPTATDRVARSALTGAPGDVGASDTADRT